MCDTHSDKWGDDAKQEFGNRVSKKFFEHFISMIPWPKSVTMTYQEFFIIELKFPWAVIYRNIKLLFEISVHPHVMISYKKVHWNSRISDFSEFTKNADKSFWDHFFIFKP